VWAWIENAYGRKRCIPTIGVGGGLQGYGPGYGGEGVLVPNAGR
jgi:hypothetical protein